MFGTNFECMIKESEGIDRRLGENSLIPEPASEVHNCQILLQQFLHLVQRQDRKLKSNRQSLNFTDLTNFPLNCI